MISKYQKLYCFVFVFVFVAFVFCFCLFVLAVSEHKFLNTWTLQLYLNKVDWITGKCWQPFEEASFDTNFFLIPLCQLHVQKIL